MTDSMTERFHSRFPNIYIYKPKGASPRMFSVSCVCTYVLLAHAGMVHRGGLINSYGIACSITIPPLAVGRSYFIFVRSEWFFFSLFHVMNLCKLRGSHPHLGFGPFWREA
jgi:hypothetical protein